MSEIMDLALSEETAYVWNAEDWLKLRRDYRIYGVLIGCLPRLPRQEVFLGLPLLLLAEETTLLIEKNIVRLKSHASMYKKPDDLMRKVFQEYKEKLFIEQEICLREQRKKQIISMMDKIIEGKKRKILGIGTSKKKIRSQKIDGPTQTAMNIINIDRDTLLQQEMAKLPKLEKSDALIQTHTSYPWLGDMEDRTSAWKYPSTPNEVIRYKVYKDLWEHGFHVTSGEKFGGDFLVYPGDPMMYHSQFIVSCIDRQEMIPTLELIAHSRVGCNVRKTQVYATLAEKSQDVKYQSFQWTDSYAL
ncbi:tRNA-splicing endonuclease subunit Sen34 [Athalia rosae]|uniref:tRNA-splicing endonuclease subunit Sen34 n=1 Tax=Athalia rosae TaxID=37344 RepID=UPI0020346806|nr:tRNA-splicing endonuclease subunit Sen34 [Athalia rosae]